MFNHLYIYYQLAIALDILHKVPIIKTAIQPKNQYSSLKLKTSRFAFASVVSILSRHTTWRTRNLVDLCVIDELSKESSFRFFLIYSFKDLQTSFGLDVITALPEGSFITSLTSLGFPAAQWLEREAWDLFGIPFSKNNDLRRLLTDYGFFGHPLRKDFPLVGYLEIFFDALKGAVSYKGITFIKPMRSFNA